MEEGDEWERAGSWIERRTVELTINELEVMKNVLMDIRENRDKEGDRKLNYVRERMRARSWTAGRDGPVEKG